MRVYQDPQGDQFSVLVVGKAGRMKRLYTPFRVICIVDVPGIKENTQVYVEAVVGTTRGELFYLIFQTPYPHTSFHILVRF